MERKYTELESSKQDLISEKDSIRAELIKTEQEKMDLHNEKCGLEQSLGLLEKTREKLEQDLSEAMKKKLDSSNSLTQVSNVWTSAGRF